MRLNARQAAFTLIEILIVIIIIAVMSAIAVPAYVRYLGHVRFQTKVKEIQDIFAYAREQAIVLDVPVTLHYDKGSASFSVDVPAPVPDNDQPAALSNGEMTQNANGQAAPPPRRVQLDQNQTVVQYTVSQASSNSNSAGATSAAAAPMDQNDLHFQGDGTVEALDMTLAQSDGKQAHLELWPVTGLLSLDPGVASQ